MSKIKLFILSIALAVGILGVGYGADEATKAEKDKAEKLILETSKVVKTELTEVYDQFDPETYNKKFYAGKIDAISENEGR